MTEMADADYQALASLRHTLRRFLHFSGRAAEQAGLTPQQHQALLAIRGSDQARLTIGELAELLLLRPHSATGLVDRLARSGLVRRVASNDDRRRVTIGLTDAGNALLGSLSAAHREELRRLRPWLVELLGRL